MTIHVNIGEAKTRLSELVAAALRGEDVVLAKAGEPQVRLTPVGLASDAERERIAAKRMAAFGMYADRFSLGFDVRESKPTDADLEERFRRKFGDPD